MKRFKFGFILIIASISIIAVGSAALSSILLERSVSAGQILVDTDQNAAVQIANISNYNGLVKTEANGEVSLNLNEAIGNNGGSGFNTDAVFTIGSPENGVIRIKNNSDIPVTVSLINNESRNSITLNPAGISGNTIGVGQYGDFYFTIDTNGRNANDMLNAVLRIEGSQN